MDIEVKSPDFDACGLFRATHSHNPTQYSHIVGLYNRDKLIAASFAFEGGLFFSKPITDWMEIPGNKIMCHEFVVVDMEYRGNGIQKRFMDATIREARQMGYDTIWCCAHPNNTPSVCSIESTGYKFADQFVVDGWPRNVYYRSTSIQR